jgi:hypothetical protein
VLLAWKILAWRSRFDLHFLALRSLNVPCRTLNRLLFHFCALHMWVLSYFA